LGTIASLSMGVADFPIEIFRAVKTKHETHKKSSKESSTSSNSNTPTLTSNSQSSDINITTLETAEPTTYFAPEAASLGGSSGPSSKVSYESSAGRSSVENSPVPDTPLSSTSSHDGHRGGSLRDALRGTLNKSSTSRSNSKDRGIGRSDSTDRRPGSRSCSRPRTPKEFDPSKLTIENAIGAGKGVQRIIAAGMKSPGDFTLALARGFHNAPKLYGDDTVRPQEKVTDLQSGLRAAGKVSLREG
jgi:hypothetical protein